MSTLLEKTIDDLRKSLPRPGMTETGVNIPERLSQLLHLDVWSKDEFSFLRSLLRKVDIVGRLKTSYRSDWTGASSSNDLDEPWKSLAALLAYRAYRQGWGDQNTQCDVASRLNVLAKLLDMVSAPWISKDSAIRAEIECEIENYLIIGRPLALCTDIVAEEETIPLQQPIRHEAIPLTVLFHEGPIARAYLETLYACGLKPRVQTHTNPITDESGEA
jgi:hypothetical protein